MIVNERHVIKRERESERDAVDTQTEDKGAEVSEEKDRKEMDINYQPLLESLRDMAGERRLA